MPAAVSSASDVNLRQVEQSASQANLDEVFRRHQLSPARAVEEAVGVWQGHDAVRFLETRRKKVGELQRKLLVKQRASCAASHRA